MIGLIDERGRLPARGSLALPGSPKSVISLFSRKPVPGATTAEPNSCSIVHVSDTALPAASITDTCVVLPFGFSGPEAGWAPRPGLGERAWAASISAARRAA